MTDESKQIESKQIIQIIKDALINISVTFDEYDFVPTTLIPEETDKHFIEWFAHEFNTTRKELEKDTNGSN